MMFPYITPKPKKYCKYPKCTNKYFFSVDPNFKNLRFFNFPKFEECCNEWKKICNIPKSVNCKYFTICEKHFHPYTYENFKLMPHTLPLSDDELSSLSLTDTLDRNLFYKHNKPILFCKHCEKFCMNNDFTSDNLQIPSVHDDPSSNSSVSCNPSSSCNNSQIPDSVNSLKLTGKCRTCLKIISAEDSELFTDPQKEMLSRCIPQIAITSIDRICNECSKGLEISYNFITQCQEAQNKLEADYDNTVGGFLEFSEHVKPDDKLDSETFKQVDPAPNSLYKDLRIQYHLQLLREGFPKLNIAANNLMEHNYSGDIKIATTAPFNFYTSLTQIVSLPVINVNDFPLPENKFDLSNTSTEKKRVLLLGTSLRGTVSCNICYKELISATSLFYHKRECSEYIARCHICRKYFFDKNDFEQHERIHKRFYKCRWCKTQFSNIIELTAHNTEICALVDHKKICSEMKENCKPNSERPERLCEICGKLLIGTYALSTHGLVHTEPQECSICKKTVKNELALRKHIYRHKNPNKFMCEQCGKVIQGRPGLKKHVLAHKNNTIRVRRPVRPPRTRIALSCEKCGKEFKKNSLLQRHRACHMRAGHYEEGWTPPESGPMFSRKRLPKYSGLAILKFVSGDELPEIPENYIMKTPGTFNFN